MTLVIKKQLVTSRAKTYSGVNSAKYITIHETANTSAGANAQVHANLQTRGFSASWHWQVDDKQAIQSFPHSVRCWHAGDGRGKGNFESIGIEICVNKDGDFTKAVENAAKLTRKIMQDEGISIMNVVQHNAWSGKNCPTNLRNGSKGVNWADFLALVKGEDSAKKEAPIKESPKKAVTKSESSPKKKSPKTALSVDGKWGKDTTRALQKALGTPVDGIISRQPRNSVTTALYGGTVSFGSGNGSPMVRALQRKVGASADGKLGPETVRKLQAYLGTVRDGKLSRPSLVVKEMQRKLNNGSF